MSVEDFRAQAYVANVEAGKVGGYLESAPKEEETVTEPVELTADEKNMEVCSAHHIAQSLSDALHLVYWFYDRHEYSHNYHAQAAVGYYNELTEKMKKAGLI